MAASQQEKGERFRELHRRAGTFVIPNPWDAGSARVLAGLGFEARATPSGACAGTLGRRDGGVTREEALAHARAVVEATDLPVSADLERCFADAPEGVAETIRLGAVRAVCAALSRPFNFMAGIKGKSFPVAELAAAGAKRISLATSLYRAAMTGLVEAAREVRERGSFGYVEASLPTPELNRFMRG